MVSDLSRFLRAQDSVYLEVLAELRGGKKKGHWMWYVFPQIKGLGRSDTANFFAISSLQEAQEYVEHAVLGERLRECTKLVASHSQLSVTEIFGQIDAIKLKSSMTLFCEAACDNSIFRSVLEVFCDGQVDQATIDILYNAREHKSFHGRIVK